MIDKTGKCWPDSEAAYKAFKTGDTPRDERVMVRVIAAKLQQHPELVEGIKERGGAGTRRRPTRDGTRADPAAQAAARSQAAASHPVMHDKRQTKTSCGTN